jgi:hypothetical protein
MDEGGRKDVISGLLPTYRKEKRGYFGIPFFNTMMKQLLMCLSILLLCGMAHAEEKRTEVPIGDSPSLGPADAPVTIIEFIDFQ